MDTLNTRVLVIEDENLGPDSIQERLSLENREGARREPAGPLLGNAPPGSPGPGVNASILLLDFEVTPVRTRDEALDRLKAEAQKGRPFALTCIQGVLTHEFTDHVLQIDANAEVLLIGPEGSLHHDLAMTSRHVDFADVRREASRSVLCWNERRRLEEAIAAIGTLKVDRATLSALLSNVIDQVARVMGSPSLLLARTGPTPAHEYTPWLASGVWSEPRLAEEMLASFRGHPVPEKPVEVGGIPVRGYRAGDLAAFWVQSGQAPSRHARLIPRLLEQAALALDQAASAGQDRPEDTFTAISQTIGTIVHDLRSPIGAIQSALDVAMMSTNEPADLWEMLEIIGRSAEDAMAIVGDIVDFTRNTTIEPQPFEVEELFDVVRERTHEVIVENSLRLSTKGASGLSAHGDRRKLERALINLVHTSARFLSRGAARATDLRLTASPFEGDLRIAVAVDGPEIPAQDQASLFDPFSNQGKDQAGRLGLAIARQIVESHGGTITLTSNGGWTTFLLTIPGPVSSLPPPPPSSHRAVTR